MQPTHSPDEQASCASLFSSMLGQGDNLRFLASCQRFYREPSGCGPQSGIRRRKSFIDIDLLANGGAFLRSGRDAVKGRRFGQQDFCVRVGWLAGCPYGVGRLRVEGKRGASIDSVTRCPNNGLPEKPDVISVGESGEISHAISAARIRGTRCWTKEIVPYRRTVAQSSVRDICLYRPIVDTIH